MQYELYIDIFFLENFIMDFFVLAIVRRTLRCSATYKRVFCGAFLGAFLSSLFLCAVLPEVLRFIIFHFIINVVMLIVGLHLKSASEVRNAFVLLYIFSFLFGGVIGWLKSNMYTTYKIGKLFISIAFVSYFVVQKILNILERIYKIPEKYFEVTLILGNQTCTVRALVDSGNHLYDALTGKPVHIISAKVMKKLTNENEISKIRYIPYRTIHEEEGVLPIIRIDKMCIHGRKELKFPLIGITAQERFAGGTFEMILHPEDC